MDTKEMENQIRLGLCCINNQLRKKQIYTNRTTIRRCYTVEKAKDLASKNLNDLEHLLKWNYDHNIFVFRLSSDIFPHYTDTEVEFYTKDFAKSQLEHLGQLCQTYSQRITMHPGQYNQVGAKNKSVYEQTVKDLTHHAEILDMMNIPIETGIINVHGGGTYGNKENTKRRWIEQFDDLPSIVKRRLSIEHCEKCYHVRDCLDISQETGIPVVFDNHHYDCYCLLHPNETIESPEELIPEVVETWKDRGCSSVLCHLSNQKENAKIGAHSDYINMIPEYYMNIFELYNMNVDIEIEAKEKELAIFDLYESYPSIFSL